MASDARRVGSQKQLAHITNAILYGIINSILAIPAIYGYTVIIFSHPDFHDFMPALAKLVVYSSAVHQVMFTLLSSLPFSIGQVQDGGLVFLSTMATSICNSLGDDVSLEAKVTTSVVTIAIATALFGICLVVMGRLKLAEFAAYLPIPVIGGYLTFIGIFCLYAGLALCTGLVVNDIQSMISVFNNAHDVLLCVPGVLGGAFMVVVSQRYDNSFILSGAIMIMPVVFFFILLVGGISMEDARDGGWIDPAKDPATVTDLVNLFDFSLVHWNELPKQLGTWVSIVAIVAFGSCLDIAAIEFDMDRKLDFNQELKTVGWSNVVSGLLGGCTGSYIFSQAIFTYRSKTNSRIVGVCVIISEFAIVLAPVSVMSYVPRFFFAATLIFIAIDLMIEWLVLAYKTMSLREYAVLWVTFVAVNVVSLDLGIAIGVGIAILNFVLGYVRLPVVNRKPRSLGAARTLTERRMLDQKHDAIAYFKLSGFLFFGSSAQILDGVQKAVYVRRKLPHWGVLPWRYVLATHSRRTPDTFDRVSGRNPRDQPECSADRVCRHGLDGRHGDRRHSRLQRLPHFAKVLQQPRHHRRVHRCNAPDPGFAREKWHYGRGEFLLERGVGARILRDTGAEQRKLIRDFVYAYLQPHQ